MLTPAEESGLAGFRLAGRVQRAIGAIPRARMAGIIREIERVSRSLHLVYQHQGSDETITVLPCPLTVLREQLAYVHAASLSILNAMKRLPGLYFRDARARQLLRLTPPEEQWLRECWGRELEESNPVFARMDAVIDLTSPMWKDSLRFIEPNLTGIGGIHVAPACDRVLMEVLIPEVRRADPALRFELATDMRELLAQELLDHLAAVGRGRGNIALIDPKYEKDGPDEQDTLARYFLERHGLTVVHADPSELSVRADEVYFGSTRVDIAYRDYTVLDLLALGDRGVDVEPMRRLFRENRMVSSIAAELDQKSCWEVLTDRAIADEFLSPEERQFVRRHVCWTRLLSDRRTTNARGERVALVDFARRERERLVLKPNRSFGGRGVLIGPSVGDGEWGAAIDAALRDSDRWVVQELAGLPVREFPVGGADGSVHQEPFYVVFGFAASPYGVASMARASQKQVVNVALHGGMCGVLVVGDDSAG